MTRALGSAKTYLYRMRQVLDISACNVLAGVMVPSKALVYVFAG